MSKKEELSKKYSDCLTIETDKETVEKYGLYRAKGLFNFTANDIEESFEVGWETALENQWISVEDEQPDPNEIVLCRLVSNGAIVSGYVCRQAGKWRVATNPDFEFKDTKGYVCDYWMYIPKMKNNGEKL